MELMQQLLEGEGRVWTGLTWLQPLGSSHVTADFLASVGMGPEPSPGTSIWPPEHRPVVGGWLSPVQGTGAGPSLAAVAVL